jgi:hypothetical protein
VESQKAKANSGYYKTMLAALKKVADIAILTFHHFHAVSFHCLLSTDNNKKVKLSLCFFN